MEITEDFVWLKNLRCGCKYQIKDIFRECFCCRFWLENQGVSDIFGEMEIYIYIHQMKALNELFLLAQLLSSMSLHMFIINNWNQCTKSDQTMVKFLLWLSCKVGEMSLMPVWFSTLKIWIRPHPSKCLAGQGLFHTEILDTFFIPQFVTPSMRIFSKVQRASP